jgi:putative transposase
LLILAGFATMIEICQVKYLNNIIEQDHRFIKKITKPMMGFKAFHSAQATIYILNYFIVFQLDRLFFRAD